jgi:arsenate reductase-like glutaredoxin family protein
VPVAETVDATKVRYAAKDALKLLAGIEKLVAARGKKIEIFDLVKDRPDDDILLAHLMGPTGNLRAPTARIGKTLVVGFNEEAYKQVLDAA